MFIFHISDLHYHIKDMNGIRNLQNVIDSICLQDIQPDVVLVTGDITHLQQSENYPQVFSILHKLCAPFLCITGNHDNSTDLMQALQNFVPEHPVSEATDKLYYMVDDFLVRIIALDSFKSNTPGGEVDEKQLAWLEEKLQNNSEGKPVLVMVHQFTINSGSDFFDIKTRQPWADKFNQIISKYSEQIKLVACGHMHNGISSNINGVPIIASFSTNWEAKTDFKPVQDPVNPKRQPGYYIHRFDGKRFSSYAITVGS